MTNNTRTKNTNTSRFGVCPSEILSQPMQSKLNYFRNQKISHPKLDKAFDELWEAVKSYNDGSLILLYGPTGVGKTTIMNFIEKKILQEIKDELLIDRERIPLVKVEIAGPSAGKFDWKDFYKEVLRELAEFSIDNRVDFSKWQNPQQSVLPFDNFKQMYSVLANDNKSTESRLRNSVEQALRHRRPKVVLLDEAQHLTALSSGRKLLDQQNVIKSLANRTNTTHALFGSYELLLFRDLNGQLARRTVNIHFQRYRKNSTDLQDFEETIWNFQNELPLEKQPDLVSEVNYLYNGCLGCIGILKDWLYRALVKALSENNETMTKQHLERTKLEEIKLLKILGECLDGENRIIKEKQETSKKLSELLDGPVVLDNGIKVMKKQYSGRTRRGVGVRNPTRDPIGTNVLA
jgi:energy-coupling factor transporter ATP-binding protein EcfA2